MGALPTLAMLQDDAVDAQVKDWATVSLQAVESTSGTPAPWANAATGADLAVQIDLGFSLSTGAPEAART